MTNRGIEFFVDGWVMGESGNFTVIGCCGVLPIRVNDVFDVVFRNKRRKYPDEVGDEPVREVEKPASLRVVCIHAYEKSLSVLGQGMTGSLVLEGEGAQYITAGWALGKRDPSREPVGHEVQSASR